MDSSGLKYRHATTVAFSLGILLLIFLATLPFANLSLPHGFSHGQELNGFLGAYSVLLYLLTQSPSLLYLFVLAAMYGFLVYFFTLRSQPRNAPLYILSGVAIATASYLLLLSGLLVSADFKNVGISFGGGGGIEIVLLSGLMVILTVLFSNLIFSFFSIISKKIRMSPLILFWILSVVVILASIGSKLYVDGASFQKTVLQDQGLVSCVQDSDCANFDTEAPLLPAAYYFPYKKVCDLVLGDGSTGKFCAIRKMNFFGVAVNGVSLSVTATGIGTATGYPSVKDPRLLSWTETLNSPDARIINGNYRISIVFPDGTEKIHTYTKKGLDTLKLDVGLTKIDGLYLDNFVGEGTSKEWFPQVGKYKVVWVIDGITSQPIDVEILAP